MGVVISAAMATSITPTTTLWISLTNLAQIGGSGSKWFINKPTELFWSSFIDINPQGAQMWHCTCIHLLHKYQFTGRPFTEVIIIILYLGSLSLQHRMKEQNICGAITFNNLVSAVLTQGWPLLQRHSWISVVEGYLKRWNEPITIQHLQANFFLSFF